MIALVVVVALLLLVVAAVTLSLTMAVLRIVREQREWRRVRAQIFRDHAEFLKGLTSSPGEQQIAPAKAPAKATVNGKVDR